MSKNVKKIFTKFYFGINRIDFSFLALTQLGLTQSFYVFIA